MSDPYADPGLVAYASLHEVVRRYLEGEASLKYLRKRHQDIDTDMKAAFERVMEREL